MTFVSGYRMIFYFFKLEQIYNAILYHLIFNTMMFSLTIIIVSKIV